MERFSLVCGAGGFVGGHLVKALLDAGKAVRAVDFKPRDSWWQVDPRAEYLQLDLRRRESCIDAVRGAESVFNLAADMGGMGFIEANRARCMLSVLINTHLLEAARAHDVDVYFFASSACVYPSYRQGDTDSTPLKELDVYPAMPENGYGWEKLFSERMCRHFFEDYGLSTRVARFHNVFGPHGTWTGGREKAPAAICRKVAQAKIHGLKSIEVWGDGTQRRSFLYIDDCIEGTLRLVESDITDPLNIGSEVVVTIEQLVGLVQEIAGVSLKLDYVRDAPLGVAFRASDNSLCRETLGWEPRTSLRSGLEQTYRWVYDQVAKVS